MGYKFVYDFVRANKISSMEHSPLEKLTVFQFV